MSNKVVDLQGRPAADPPYPVPDFWFAQVDLRLSRIELMIARLEWQVWLMFCCCAGLLMFETLKVLSGGTT